MRPSRSIRQLCGQGPQPGNGVYSRKKLSEINEKIRVSGQIPARQAPWKPSKKEFSGRFGTPEIGRDTGIP
jgi:hypothetical protein